MINILFTFFKQKLEQEVFEYYLALLPESMQERLRKYRRWQDAQCGLFGKILLVEGLKKYGITAPRLNDVRYTEYNRPYLNEAVDFNISHSGMGVVCALSENATVGIDIEEVKPINIAEFQRQFTGRELSLMYNSPDPDSEFFRWWTKKEAIIKADGKGLSIPLKEISFENPGKAEVNGRTWQILEIDLHKQYRGHLAFAAKSSIPVKAEQYSIQKGGLVKI